ncbi:hypothetical protein TNIN_129791 [Trichonephila inaurata madagascariensis]|uniref:Uncharacterized protein n=1 Tax=Trichonephila inaurata madagascariensis TaxID=2747483 RepID=A0A8X6JT39_9ARAC|nr:hypothetical protein TNIN_129791 [Trichonephila inaurata madagascariensis]
MTTFMLLRDWSPDAVILVKERGLSVLSFVAYDFKTSNVAGSWQMSSRNVVHSVHSQLRLQKLLKSNPRIILQRMKLQNPIEHELACYLLLRLVGYQSSLWPTKDFHNMWPSLLVRSTRLVFLIPMGCRSTGSTIQ